MWFKRKIKPVNIDRKIDELGSHMHKRQLDNVSPVVTYHPKGTALFCILHNANTRICKEPFMSRGFTL